MFVLYIINAIVIGEELASTRGLDGWILLWVKRSRLCLLLRDCRCNCGQAQQISNIIAYKSYRQTLLLSPLKSLQSWGFVVITHFAAAVGTAEIIRRYCGSGTWAASDESGELCWGATVPGMEGYAICRIKFSLHLLFNAIEIWYPPKKSPYIPQWYRNDFSLITSYIHLHPTSCLTLHQMLDGKNTYQKPNQGRGHVLQQANGLGSRLTTIWQQEVVGKNGGGNQMVMVFPLRAENSTGFNYRVGFWGGWGWLGLGWFAIFFIWVVGFERFVEHFHSGDDPPFDELIFQMGWNHQLEKNITEQT